MSPPKVAMGRRPWRLMWPSCANAIPSPGLTNPAFWRIGDRAGDKRETMVNKQYLPTWQTKMSKRSLTLCVLLHLSRGAQDKTDPFKPQLSSMSAAIFAARTQFSRISYVITHLVGKTGHHCVSVMRLKNINVLMSQARPADCLSEREGVEVCVTPLKKKEQGRSYKEKWKRQKIPNFQSGE